MIKFFFILLICSQLLACGIKGSLYLPPEPEADEAEANEASA